MSAPNRAPHLPVPAAAPALCRPGRARASPRAARRPPRGAASSRPSDRTETKCHNSAAVCPTRLAMICRGLPSPETLPTLFARAFCSATFREDQETASHLGPSALGRPGQTAREANLATRFFRNPSAPDPRCAGGSAPRLSCGTLRQPPRQRSCTSTSCRGPLRLLQPATQLSQERRTPATLQRHVLGILKMATR